MNNISDSSIFSPVPTSPLLNKGWSIIIKKILSFCGSHSGRDVDKASACGLTAFQTPCGSVAFEESKLYFECRKMYAQQMHASSFIDKEALDKWYSKDPMHKMYVAEILGAYSAH